MDALKRSKQLQDIPEFKDVFIRPDLTAAQRDRRKELTAERDLKNSAITKVNGRFVGPFYFGIRDDAVVKIYTKTTRQSTNATPLPSVSTAVSGSDSGTAPATTED